MSRFIFTNFAKSTLAGLLSTSATSLTVQAGDGALFPSPSSGQVAPLVLVNTATPNAPPYEIVYCTARSSDTMTVLRAQEGTSAQNWNAGSIVSNRITAGGLANISLPGGPVCDTKEFYSGAPVTINNNAVPSYTILQTVNFTFPPAQNTLTGQFLLFIESIISFGGNPGSVTFTGSITAGGGGASAPGVLTVTANPNNGLFVPGQVVYWGSSPANYGPLIGYTGTPGQYYIDAGSNVTSQVMTLYDQFDYGQVLSQVRDTTDTTNLIFPVAQFTLVSAFGGGFQLVHSGFASNNPTAGGSGDLTFTFAAGTTYTLKQKVALSNAGAFPIPSGTASGQLILTAVSNQ